MLLSGAIYLILDGNPQVSILSAGPKPIATNAFFVPYKEPTMQPDKKVTWSAGVETLQ